MEPWNVVVSVHEKHYQEALALLRTLGRVHRTDFYNVLVVRVDDVDRALDTLSQRLQQEPQVKAWLSRIVPVTTTFVFQSPPEFERQASQAVRQWAPLLAGKSFHIRMHRRGFKGRLSSQDEERFLDRVIIDALAQDGKSAHIDFESPDAIIAVETVGQQAGLSFWTRQQLEAYPFLRLD